MRFRSAMLAGLMALAACVALAHGNKIHVMGTVEKINADSVVVKAKDGKSVEVKLVQATVYIRHIVDSSKPASPDDDKPAKLSELAVGDMVVIHATPKENNLQADEVKFSVPGASKPTGSVKPNS
jgi:hypothetical protein